MKIIIKHNNGIEGQVGFSEHEIENELEGVKKVIEYWEIGIQIFDYYLEEN